MDSIFEKQSSHPTTSLNLKNYSVIQQSLACHQKKISARVLKAPTLIPLVIPFFEALDKMLMRYLSMESDLGRATTEKIYFLLSIRNQLRRFLESSSELDVPRFSLYITWISSQLRKIVAEFNGTNNSGLVIDGAFEVVLQNIVEHVKTEIGPEFKCVLWKKGGNSFPLRNIRARDTYNALAKYRSPERKMAPNLQLSDFGDNDEGDRIQKRNTEATDDGFIFPEHKRMLLEGMTTLTWLDANLKEIEETPSREQETEDIPMEDPDKGRKLLDTLTVLPRNLMNSLCTIDVLLHPQAFLLLCLRLFYYSQHITTSSKNFKQLPILEVLFVTNQRRIHKL